MAVRDTAAVLQLDPEKYHVGHHCKKLHLFLIEGEDSDVFSTSAVENQKE